MRTTRGYKGSRRKRRFAKGKKAFAICDRTGFKISYRDMVKEPGTGLFVDKSWSDGRWNRVDHPQNFPADVSENIGLKNPRTDRTEPLPNYLISELGMILANGKPIYLGEV